MMGFGRIATGYRMALVGACCFLAPVTAAAQQSPEGKYLLQAVPQSCPPGQSCTATAPRFGLRCRTARLLCTLSHPGPINTNCYCNTPTGRQVGKVVE